MAGRDLVRAQDARHDAGTAPGPAPDGAGHSPVAEVLALQRAAGNVAVGRMLARAKKKESFSQGSTIKTLSSHHVKSKTTFTGEWSPQYGVSGSKSFEESRDPQLLRHIATQLYLFVKIQLDRGKEQEVQVLLVNNRLVVAANDSASTKALAQWSDAAMQQYKKDVLVDKKTPNPVEQLFKTVQRPKDVRALGVAAKMTGLLEGEREFEESEAVQIFLGALTSSQPLVQGDISSDAAAKTTLTDPKYELKIVLATGGGMPHAEQNLILAMYRAGIKDAAPIFGKKRPCTGCEATFAFATQILGLQLEFNPNPGGFWGTSAKGLLALAKEAIGKGDTTAEAYTKWLKAYADQYKVQPGDDEPALMTYQTQEVAQGKRKKAKSEVKTFKEGSKVEFTSEYDSPSESEPEEDIVKGLSFAPPPPKKAKAPKAPAKKKKQKVTQ